MKPRNMEHNEKFTINCPKGPITDLKIVDQRFFSCGSENDTLVELDKNDGLVKISYTGFINAEKRPTRITVIKSQSEESKELIAVPDGKSVKIWQIDDNQLALKVIPNDTTHPVVSGLDSNSNGKLLAIYYENTNFVDFYSVTSNAPERVAQSDKKRKRNSSPSSQRKSSKLDQQKSDSDVEDIEVDKELEADRLETEKRHLKKKEEEVKQQELEQQKRMEEKRQQELELLRKLELEKRQELERKQEEEKRLEEQRRIKQKEEEQRQMALELKRQQEEEKRIEEQKKLEEQKRILEEQKRIEEQKRMLEEQKKLEEQKRMLEEQKKLEEQKRILEEQKRIEEQKKIEEQKRALEEQKRALEEQKKIEEKKRAEEKEEQKRLQEDKEKINAKLKTKMQMLQENEKNPDEVEEEIENEGSSSRRPSVKSPRVSQSPRGVKSQPETPKTKEERKKERPILKSDAISTYPKTFQKASQITKLIFSHRGISVLAIDSNGNNFVWKWKGIVDGKLSNLEVSTKVIPLLPKFPETPATSPPILCLSTNDSFLVSSMGGSLNLYNNITRVKITSLHEPNAPLQVPTAFAFNPADNNLFIFGLKNGNLVLKAIKQKREWQTSGHEAAISDMAFYKATRQTGNIITCALDGYLKIWQYELKQETEFEMTTKTNIRIASEKIPLKLHLYQPSDQPSDQVTNPRVLIEQQSGLTLVNLDEGQTAGKWTPQTSTLINGVACDLSQNLVYVLLNDKSIAVCDLELAFVGHIGLERPYFTIAVNPRIPYQICLGDDDGAIIMANLQTILDR